MRRGMANSPGLRVPPGKARAWLIALLLMAVINIAACTNQDTPQPASSLTLVATNPVVIGNAATPSVATPTTAPSSPTLSPPPATQPATLTAPAASASNPPAAAGGLEPTATPTATPPTSLPTATPIPTSSSVPGWLTYENDFLGYRFSYPPEARISTQGVTGFPTDELPENVTAEEYLAQLEAKYPDDLCVTVSYETIFIAFVPPSEGVGAYTVPCGVTGVGDYTVESNVESLIVGNKQMIGRTFWLYGEVGVWRGEFTMLEPDDSVGIHYGSANGSTHEEFLAAQERMMQIVLSFREE